MMKAVMGAFFDRYNIRPQSRRNYIFFNCLGLADPAKVTNHLGLHYHVQSGIAQHNKDMIRAWAKELQAVSDGDAGEDVCDTFAVRCISAVLGDRLVRSYDKTGVLFPTGPGGKRCFSLLFFVIVCLEFTDLVFAVDSATAKIAQLSNQYVAYSSSVLAMFGLRAMFFVLKDMVEYFELLKYGLCIILVFVGVELIAAPLLHLESATVCIVIASVFVVSIAASTAKKFLADRDGAGRGPQSLITNAVAYEAG